MKRYPGSAAAVFLTLLLAASGCKRAGEAQLTPTPVPTPTPTPVPMATLAPTATPTAAPKAIGLKTSLSKSLYLNNGTGRNLRELYLRAYGAEDWGRNLIPAESAVESSQQVVLYYVPESTGEGEVWYDMRILDGTGAAFEMNGIRLGHMSSAVLKAENGEAYFIYMDSETGLQRDSRNDEPPAPAEESYENYDFTDTFDSSAGIPQDDGWYVYDPGNAEQEEADGYVDWTAGDYDGGYSQENPYTEYPQESFEITWE